MARRTQLRATHGVSFDKERGIAPMSARQELIGDILLNMRSPISQDNRHHFTHDGFLSTTLGGGARVMHKQPTQTSNEQVEQFLCAYQENLGGFNF